MKKTLYSLLAARHRKHAIQNLRRLEASLISPQSRLAIPFVFRGKGHFKSMACMQNPDEIERLYSLVCQLKPKHVLEIGTAKGGALYLWLQASSDRATVVSVDLPDGEFGGGYPTSKIPFYQVFAKSEQTLHLVRDNSHSLKTLGNVKELFQEKPIDFLFIDGDHTYDGVKQDFQLYGPLVRQGGVIAFHDILPRPDLPEIQVNRFWEEIKSRFNHQEIIGKDGSGRKIGCGVVYYS